MASSEFTLYIHVGSGKAGSTSIQTRLNQSGALLEKSRLKYLGLMFENVDKPKYGWQKSYGWPDFLNVRNNEDGIGQLLTVIDSELSKLKAAGYRGAVWSNESLFPFQDVIEPVIELTRKMQVKVVIIGYVRNHFSWAVSAYKQWGIKHKTYSGPVKSFKQWVSERNLEFMPNVRRWRRLAKGNFYLRNFDACGDVVEDFFGLIGLEYQPSSENFQNSSPNEVAMALWAIYNSQIKGEVLPAELEPLLEKSGVLRQEFQSVNYSALLPSEGDLDTIKSQCNNDLNELNQLFGEMGQAPLQFKSSVKKTAVTNEDLVAALLLMIQRLNKEVTVLRRRVNKLSRDDRQ